MLRFTIRDAILVTTIVAVALGWWFDHRKKDAALQAAANQEMAFESLLEHVVEKLDWTIAVSRNRIVISEPGDKPGRESFRASWYIQGDAGAAKVWSSETLRAEEEAEYGKGTKMPWDPGSGV